MTYILTYQNEIGENSSTIRQFQSFEDAQSHFQKLKQAFESDCKDAGFLDCISVKTDTPTRYEATDGEDWIDIRILTEV